MRRMIMPVALAALAAACHNASVATTEARQPEPDWGPAPAIFPAGAQMAVMQGNPGAGGEFTVRLLLPDGYRIPPHTHPTDEHVTVIRGTFKVGMGERFRTDSLLSLAPGGFVTAPAGHAHFAVAQGRTVVQVHAIGPFALTYVDPADTPRGASER